MMKPTTPTPPEPTQPPASVAARARLETAQAILRKIKAGKPATKAELALVQEVEAEQEAAREAPASSAAGPIVVNRKTIELFFSVTAQAISDWCAKGMPKESKGRYDLVRCFHWWRDYINARESAKDQTLTEAKREYWGAKAEAQRLEVDTRKGKLIRLDDVLRHWSWRVAEVSTGLESLAVRLPAMLEGCDQVEMRTKITAEVRQLRAMYARNGKYCRTEKPGKKISPRPAPRGCSIEVPKKRGRPRSKRAGGKQ